MVMVQSDIYIWGREEEEKGDISVHTPDYCMLSRENTYFSVIK